ncbi:hypothetical protein [Acidovorax sacchari]|uniref:hypothetical protein n=1 Tax=Acidovorax sacchari TaxID=3230736 RepID=UPI0039E3859E
MVENPGLSYGLFQAVAQPVYSWGVVRRVEFPGVNIDIGHMRNLAWSRSNDKAQWVAYNRMRGQYMSALEHAVPERFFSDPAKCNLAGSANPVAGLPDCPQGISAVKALGLAAQQGQKIYTITPQVYANQPNIVNTALVAHSPGTRAKVQAALDEGKEVTIHEAPIAQSGWVGAGFTVLEEGTGAGAYTIEGGSNGGWFSLVGEAGGALLIIIGLASLLAKAGLIAAMTFVPWLMLAVAAITLISIYLAGDGWDPKGCGGIDYCDSLDAIQIFSALGAMAALLGAGSIVGLALGLYVFYQITKGKFFY